MLTDKQRAFVAAYLASSDPEKAAISAGYSRPGARKTAWRLLRRPDVIAEIERLKPVPVSDLAPLDYMLQVLRDPSATIARRTRMAIAAAPYLHPKALAGSVKESKAEAAKRVTGKFKPQSAPTVLPFRKQPK